MSKSNILNNDVCKICKNFYGHCKNCKDCLGQTGIPKPEDKYYDYCNNCRPPIPCYYCSGKNPHCKTCKICLLTNDIYCHNCDPDVINCNKCNNLYEKNHCIKCRKCVSNYNHSSGAIIKYTCEHCGHTEYNKNGFLTY
jgi:hypothetical protein